MSLEIEQYQTLILSSLLFVGAISLYVLRYHKVMTEQYRVSEEERTWGTPRYKNNMLWLDNIGKEHIASAMRHDDTLENQLFFYEQKISDIYPSIIEIENACLDMNDLYQDTMINAHEKFQLIDQTIKEFSKNSVHEAIQIIGKHVEGFDEKLNSLNNAILSISEISKKTENNLQIVKRAYGL